jgi:hypothetical protein
MELSCSWLLFHLLLQFVEATIDIWASYTWQCWISVLFLKLESSAGFVFLNLACVYFLTPTISLIFFPLSKTTLVIFLEFFVCSSSYLVWNSLCCKQFWAAWVGFLTNTYHSWEIYLTAYVLYWEVTGQLVSLVCTRELWRSSTCKTISQVSVL